MVVTALSTLSRSGDYVFPGRFGGPVTPATIWDWIRYVADDAGLGKVPPHVLRHLCLATQNDATGDLRTVQHFAGHSNPQTTSGYTRSTNRRLRAAVLAIDY
ncbi:MAG: tyrosine-type recombinase/integrase [Actinomycetota bacterium]|nr:tyrosine-type recombinase/integrase [Actinomycetota bacterium]